MLFWNIDIINEHFEYIKGYYVGIIGKKITYVSKEPPLDTAPYGEIYDGRGKVLMPGFVNAHSHSAMTLLRGYAENLALSDWLNTKIFPFEAHLDADAVYDGTMLAAAEMLKFGITSTTDMYAMPDSNARAVLDSGIKMNMGIPITCFDGRSLREHPVYEVWNSAIPAYHGAGDGRLLTDIAIHAEYTSTPRIVRDVADYVEYRGLRLHMHLSETKSEHEACKARYSMTPAAYFASLGAFDVPTSAAHCVWLEDEDIDILKTHGVTVASCPVSNLKLASGFVRARDIMSLGVNFALGTDSVSSNNNLNMLEEVKTFATLFKATTADPTAITPKEALYAATRAGAIAQGRMDTGLICEGFDADVIVLDYLNAPHLHPCTDMLNNIVFSALGSDIVLTMVDGRVLYRNGAYTSLDIERVISNAESSFERVLSRL